MSLAGPAFASDSDDVGLRVRANTGPPATVTDLAAASSIEGQIDLNWTAPDENAVFPTGYPVSSYEVRRATFSVDSVGGSTTAWWNGAAVHMAFGPGLLPGNKETPSSGGFEPGATYYFAVQSADDAGFVSLIDDYASTPGAQAKIAVFDAVPPAPSALTLGAVANTSISLSWTASPATDLWTYRLHVDATPPYDFADEFTITVSSNLTSYLHSGLAAATSYYYYVTAVDKGAPTYKGLPLESAASNIVNAVTGAAPKVPMAPFGLGMVYSSSTAVLSWMPVRHFVDLTPFADPYNALGTELSAYRVYRATAPVKAPWTELVALSTSTYSWLDNFSGPQFYYHVKAENAEGLSALTMARAQTGSQWLIGYDGISAMEIPENWAAALTGTGLDPETAYRLDTSSHPEDLDGKIVKSVELRAWKGGVNRDTRLELGGAGHLHLHHAGAAPKTLSVFWYNGNKWLQLYGKHDALNEVMNLDAKYLGRYQLRSVERAEDFLFNPAGVSNRSITPNGDGMNDSVVFTFDNPKDSSVKGRILGRDGSVIAILTQGPIGNSLLWDGRSAGRTVPGGVYIYELQSEGKTFTGTIFVIK